MPDFRLQLLYKSPCSVWCNNAFMSRFPYGRRWLLCIVRNSFRNSWLPILASIPSKLSLLLYCRVNDGKAVTAWKRLTETVYTLYGWDSVAIIRLRHILHLRKVSTCFLCSFSLFLLDRKRITYQATLFICDRSTRLYSGVLTYALPIILYVLWGYASATDTAIAFLASQGQALFGIFQIRSDSCIICFSISRYTGCWSVTQYLKYIAILSTYGKY